MKTIEDDLVHKTVSQLFDMVKSQQVKIDELQNRVDKALEKAYTGIRKQGGDYYLELVEGILKGESNE